MKISKMLIAMILAVVCFVQPLKVNAQVEYDLTHQEIIASISSDGSVKFVDYQTYDAEFINGVYFNLDRINYDVIDYRVGILDSYTNQIEYFEENVTGSPRTFQTTQTNELYTFKVFYPAQKEKVTFVFEYTLGQLVTNFSDTAELNRKIVGTGTDEYMDVDALIILPGKVRDADDFRAWAHGAPQGTVELTEYEGKSAVKLEVPNNPPGQFVEVDVIFPTALTPNNQNRRQVDKKADIIAREDAQVAKDKQAYESSLGWKSFFAMLAVAFMPIMPIGLILYYRAKRIEYNPHPEKLPRHIYYLPEDLTPAIMATAFFRKAPTTDDLTATVVDLARKGFLKLTPVKKEKRGFFSRGEDETILVEPILNPNNQIQLQKHEQFALNYILPYDKAMTLQELEDELAKNRSLRKKQSNLWTKFVNFAEIKGMQIKKGPAAQTIIMSFAILVAILIPILGAIAVAMIEKTPYQLHVQTIVIVSALSSFTHMGVILWALFKPIVTAEYDRRKQEWTGFKNMLSEVGNFNMREIGSLDLWEEYLVYAISLGVAEKVVEAMKMQFKPIEFEELQIGGGFYMNPYLMTRTLNNSVTNSVQISQPISASYSGSNSGGFGGGFSGGSSGGSGGGSGSGGF